MRSRQEYENSPLFLQQVPRGKSGLPAALERRLQPALAAAVSSGSTSASSSATKRRTQFHVAQRQSGVKGVNWQKKRQSWAVQWKSGRRVSSKTFAVANYLKLGVSVEEADQLALQAAVALRQSLVASGMAQVQRAAHFQSAVKGVSWNSRDNCWRVQLPLPREPDGKRHRKAKNFVPEDMTAEAVERARVDAVSLRAEWEKKYACFNVRAASDCASTPP